jgi:hypothetical protein
VNSIGARLCSAPCASRCAGIGVLDVLNKPALYLLALLLELSHYVGSFIRIMTTRSTCHEHVANTHLSAAALAVEGAAFDIKLSNTPQAELMRGVGRTGACQITFESEL